MAQRATLARWAIRACDHDCMDRPRVSVVDGGVERVPLRRGGACWICKKTAVAGERLPGKRHKTRPLCEYHADLVFRPGSLTEPHAEDDGSAADGTRVRLPALPRVTSATRRASRNSRCFM